jgi:hypothetical protein
MNTLMAMIVAFSLSEAVDWCPVHTEWLESDTIICVMCNEQREPHCIVVIATTEMGIILYGFQGECGFEVYNLFNQLVETPLGKTMQKLLNEYCSEV